MKHAWLITVVIVSGLLTGCSTPVQEVSPSWQDNRQRAERAKQQIMVMLPLAAEMNMRNRGRSLRQSYRGKLITLQQKMAKRIRALQQAYPIKQISAWPLQTINLYCVLFEVTQRASPQVIARQITAEPDVDSAQIINLFQVLSVARHEPFQHLQHGLQTLGVAGAHRIATGNNVRIAVIDSGIDIRHPELDRRVVEVQNFVDQPLHTFTRDIHGTAVAGVIAAEAGNQTGITGVAPRASLLALKACWQTRQQWGEAYCSSFSLAMAINFAVIRKAAVINLSLGGPPDIVIERLIKKAMDDGITVVAASAFDKQGRIRFPASIPGVIAVASGKRQPAGLLRTAASPSPQLIAPGNDILTTVPGDGYGFLSGSSLATAFVSGMAALLLEHKSDLTPTEVYVLLNKSATPSGHGKMINACRALALLLNKQSCH